MTDYGDIQIVIALVNHQKQPGTIKCSMQYVIWEPDLIGEKVEIPIENVKSHKISPDGKSKVQIQIITKDAKALNFHFTINDPPGKAKEDRDKVKIHLARLAGRVVSKKTDKALEEKRKILQENPELRKIYQDLVVTGMILPEEFWSSRSHLINSTSHQNIGVSGNFLSEVQKSDGSNSIRYNLNDEMKEIIFRTYPAVKAKCLELCPAQMGEKEFWTEFFQSQYFHRDRQPTSKKDKAIFEECDRMEARDVRKQGKSDFLRINDIFEDNETQNDETDVAAEKLKMKDKKQKQNLTQKEINRMLIRRFNQHSSLVLKASERLKRPAGQPAPSTVPLKQSRDQVLELKKENEDLEICKSQEGHELRLNGKSSFLTSTASEDSNSSLLAKLKERQRRSCLEKFSRATNDYTPQIDETIRSAQHRFADILLELKKAQKKIRDEAHQTPSLDAEDAMLQCRELLTHFWSCFPPKPDMKERLERIYKSIIKFKDNKLEEIEDDGSDVLINEMREMVDAASTKFKKFQENEAKRRR